MPKQLMHIPHHPYRRVPAVILALLVSLVVSFQSFAQNEDRRGQGRQQRGPQKPADMSVEEWNKQQIARFNAQAGAQITAIVEGIEGLQESQIKPLQDILAAFYRDRYVNQRKLQQLRASGQRDRTKMMEMRENLGKIHAKTNKDVKKLLEKKQFKQYTKLMKKINPEPQAGGGGGRGGGGGGGRG